MQKKVKVLFASENSFKKAASEASALPKSMGKAERKQAMEAYQKKEEQFSEMIDSYNSSLNEYMLRYTEMCEELSELETSRKVHFRDSISKLVIFELNYIKNLEYNFARYMDNLNKMEGKLIIENRMMGATEPFYTERENAGPLQLARISNKNYIESVSGKRKMVPGLLSEEGKIA
jgi:predicted  nucleic acid-binding Zn-ribbon protein